MTPSRNRAGRASLRQPAHQETGVDLSLFKGPTSIYEIFFPYIGDIVLYLRPLVNGGHFNGTVY